jgi:Zn-finger nucleic acid-binding protein
MMEDAEAVGVVCPNCRVDLVMAERHGVEIDYCPKCRGGWLDRLLD